MPDLIPVPVAYATQPRGNMTSNPPGDGCRYFQVTCAGCGRQEAAEWHVTQSGPTRDAATEPTYGVPWPSGLPWKVVGILSEPEAVFVRRGGEWVCGPACALRTSHRDIQALWPDFDGGGWVMPTDSPGEVQAMVAIRPATTEEMREATSKPDERTWVEWDAIHLDGIVVQGWPVDLGETWMTLERFRECRAQVVTVPCGCAGHPETQA